MFSNAFHVHLQKCLWTEKASIWCFLGPKALWKYIIKLGGWGLLNLFVDALYQQSWWSVLLPFQCYFYFIFWNRINSGCLEWHWCTIMASLMQWCLLWVVCKVKYPTLVQVGIFILVFYNFSRCMCGHLTVWGL